MKDRQYSAIYRFVSQIPRGKVLSYGEVGRMVGTGARQVGAAMRQCPAGIPWHRVVGAGGKIVTREETALRQRELLMLEGIRFRGNTFSYSAHEWRVAKRSARVKCSH